MAFPLHWKNVRERFGRIRWSVVSLAAIFIFSLVFCYRMRFMGEEWKNIISTDGVGYYAYLPAAFIYHDYTYSFIDKLSTTYRPLKYMSDLGHNDELPNKRVNK